MELRAALRSPFFVAFPNALSNFSVMRDFDEKLEKKIDAIAAKLRLWYVIPLAICGIIAWHNPLVGLAFFAFLVFSWLLVSAISKLAQWIISFLPMATNAATKGVIFDAVSATIWVGCFAAVGMTFAPDCCNNSPYLWTLPEGMYSSFLQAVFAMLLIGGIWALAAWNIYFKNGR